MGVPCTRETWESVVASEPQKWIQRVMMSPLWNSFTPYFSETLLNKEVTEWVMCSESPSVRTPAAWRCDYSDNPSSTDRLHWEETHGKAKTSHQTLQHSINPHALSLSQPWEWNLGLYLKTLDSLVYSSKICFKATNLTLYQVFGQVTCLQRNNLHKP